MEEIIKKYLSDSYELNLKTYTNYKLYDKALRGPIYMQNVYNECREIFGLEDEVFEVIWDSWLSNEITNFENKLTDIQFLVYEKTGLELNFQNNRWADLITEEVEKEIEGLLNG